MESHSLTDQVYKYSEHINLKTLEKSEELISLGNLGLELNVIQGDTLRDLADETEGDLKFTYWLGSVGCYSRDSGSAMYSALPLLKMANHIDSDFYYKISMKSAEEGLYQLQSLFLNEDMQKIKEELEMVIDNEEDSVSNTSDGNQTDMEEELNGEEELLDVDFGLLVDRLRSGWKGWSVDMRKNFMKVRVEDLKREVGINFAKEGVQALCQALRYARKHAKWKFWLCRSCLKRFVTQDECKNHLETDHDASTEYIPQRISNIWYSMISVGGWEPIDSAAAVRMIKSQLQDVKSFAYENGWSRDWPRAVDEERGKLLKEIQFLLMSFYDLKVFSCSIRDRLIHFLAKKLDKSGVSRETITDCGLGKTPQGLCFLDCDELSQTLALLSKVKRERNDGKDVVCRAVNSFCGRARYKERIDFDTDYSCLLLDKRLLHCKVDRFDDEGRISTVLNPKGHYDKSRPSGDDFMSWLSDYTAGYKNFRFPRSVRAHNIGIWVAVLRAVQFTCKTMGTKHSKKLQLLEYDTALSEARKLCFSEDDRRKFENSERKSYASLLRDKCEEGDAAKAFLRAVGDILGEEKDIEDEKILDSIELLKEKVGDKLPLLDSKILLIDNSRTALLNDLTRLALFDYRFYIHHPLSKMLEEALTALVPRDPPREV